MPELDVVTWFSDHFVDVTLFAVLLGVGWVAALLVRRLLKRRLVDLSDDATAWQTALRWATRWLPRLLVVAAALIGMEVFELVSIRAIASFAHRALNFKIFELQHNSHITLMTVVTVVVVLYVTSFASRSIQHVVGRSLNARDSADEGVIAALQRLTHYGIMTVGLAVGLQTAGVNLSALLAASAVFAVGLGLGLQNLAQNFISGIVLLVERSIKPGDTLEVEGRVVRVHRMGMRATVGLTHDGEELIIPNSILMESSVLNKSLETPLIRVGIDVGVAYESDLHATRDALMAAAASVKLRSTARDPQVLLADFGTSSVDFRVFVWVQDPFTAPVLCSELRFAVWDALAEAGIVIAFPQLDLHLDPPVTEALARLPRTG